MKKIYTKPELEVGFLRSVDMIHTSGPDVRRGQWADRDYNNLSRERDDDDDDW